MMLENRELGGVGVGWERSGPKLQHFTGGGTKKENT